MAGRQRTAKWEVGRRERGFECSAVCLAGGGYHASARHALEVQNEELSR